MSKSMIRKSLAIVSASTLGVAGLIGAPAYAAGTIDGKVTLEADAGTTFGMLTGLKFDLDANFATSADNGTPLKFYVTDPNEISVYDIDGGSIGDFDTLAADDGSGDINALQEIQGATDTVIAAFDGASGIELGDVVDGDSIAVTDGTTEVLTELNGKVKVSAVKEVAAGNMTSFSSTAKETDNAAGTVTFTVTKSSHGIADGDIVLIASSDTSTGTTVSTDTASEYESALDGYHAVTAADANTFSFVVTTAANTVGNTAQTDVTFNAGTVAVHNITVELAGTTDVTADSAVLTGSIAGGFDELTDGDALDAADELILASFGLAGISGAGAEKTDASAGRNSDGSYIVDTTDTNDAGADSTLRLAATAAGSVDVQAWVDSDDDNVIDSNEYASPIRTVTFTDAADATFTTSLTAPAAGTSSNNLVAVVDIAPSVNVAQFASGDVKVDFGVNGSSTDADISAAYDTTKKQLIATASQSVDGGDIVYAEAQFGTKNYGGKVYQTVESATADIGASGDTSNAGVATPVIAVSDSWNGTNVRSGTANVQVSSKVTTYVASGTAPAAPAGVTAKVTITKSVLDSASTVVAGGKTLASTDTSITYNTVTNADGKVVVDLVATGKKNDSVTVAIQVLDSDSADDGTSPDAFTTAVSLAVTWADAAIGSPSLIETSTYGDANADDTDDAERSVAKGGTLTLNYYLRDSFGAPLTTSGYRLAITSGSVTGGGSVSGYATVVNGLASFTFTDNTVAASGKYTISADVEKVNDAGSAYATVAAGSDLDIVVNVGVAAAASITAPADYTSSDTKETIEVETLVGATDARKQGLTFPYTGGNGHQIVGVVKGSTGGGLPGVPVTITSPGAGFVTDSNGTAEVYGVGSITVYTSSTGAYSVFAYSNSGGSRDFTITSGSASKTHSWTWGAAGAKTGTSVTVDAPAYAAPGSTFKVTVTVADQYGNAIDTDGTNTAADAGADFQITYDGPGIVFGSLPTQTDSKGKASFSILLGSNDTGAATITASYDQNGDADYADAKDVTTVSTVTVGTAPTAQKVNAGSFKGYVAVYAKGYEGQRLSAKIGNDWVIVPSIPAATNDLYRLTDFTGAGVDIAVRIYIDRVLIDTINLTTK